MMTRLRPVLSALSALLLPGLLSASPAFAGEDEIIVTATRTGETRLEDTPLAITVHSAEELNLYGVEEFDDLVRFTPGLSISENTNLAQVYIRGIGTNNVFIGSDPSVPIHLDGVYIARPLASVFDMLNVQRIEVLKGPQGTLYGRNATGGTVNIITELPDQRINNWVSVDVGKFDKKRFKLHASGPLIDNVLAGNFEVLRHDRDGFVDNINPAGHDPLSDEHRTGFAGTLRWFLSDNAEFILKGDRFEMDETGVSFKPQYRNRDGSNPVNTPVAGPPACAAPCGDNGTFISDFHTVSVPFKPEMESVNYGWSGKLVLDLSDHLTFTSLTAYRNLDAYVIADVDWTDATANTGTTNPITDLREEQEQWSQEFQFNGVQDNLTWLGGLYYFYERHDSLLRPNAPTNSIDSFVESESVALFANGTWQLTERLSATAGGRYNYDTKQFRSNATIAIFSGAADEDDTWNAFLPKVGLNYDLNDRTMIYGTVSKGYKSGGYNPTSFNFAPFNTSADAFDPEDVLAYEGGIKTQTSDRKLRLNTALFYYDYKDIQVQNFLGAGRVQIANAGDAESFGAEVEGEWNPSASWGIDFGISYLHAQFLDGATAQGVLLAGPVSISGNSLPVSPEWTANIGANYYQELDDGSLHYRLNFYRQTQEFYSSLNDDINSQNAYDVTSARVSYLSRDEQWEVSMYGDNLTNTDYSSAGVDFNNRGVALSINPPRTYGLQVIWRGL